MLRGLTVCAMHRPTGCRRRRIGPDGRLANCRLLIVRSTSTRKPVRRAHARVCPFIVAISQTVKQGRCVITGHAKGEKRSGLFPEKRRKLVTHETRSSTRRSPEFVEICRFACAPGYCRANDSAIFIVRNLQNKMPIMFT